MRWIGIYVLKIERERERERMRVIIENCIAKQFQVNSNTKEPQTYNWPNLQRRKISIELKF